MAEPLPERDDLLIREALRSVTRSMASVRAIRSMRSAISTGHLYWSESTGVADYLDIASEAIDKHRKETSA